MYRFYTIAMLMLLLFLKEILIISENVHISIFFQDISTSFHHTYKADINNRFDLKFISYSIVTIETIQSIKNE